MESSHLVLLLVVVSVSGQAQTCLDYKGENFTDCQSCLVEKEKKDCGWCLDYETPNEPSLAKGCIPRDFYCKTWYEDGEDGNNPRPFRGDSIEAERTRLKMRPNKEKNINFKAKKKQNPVDMYFLLDLTGSMRTIKQQLEDITEGLMEVRILLN